MIDREYQLADLRLEIAGMTDKGLARSSNEDSLLILQSPGLSSRFMALTGVFDGVGGQVHGGRASSSAADYLAQQVSGSSTPLAGLSAPEEELKELIRQLHKRLKLDGKLEPKLQGMATTAIIALLDNTFPTIRWIGHVGDSPGFRLRNGDLQKLTKEDSIVCDLVREGVLAPEDAARHPRRNIITQALGGRQEITPHVAGHSAKPGDCFMLCTDGLTTMVPEDTIGAILDSEPPLEACKQLIDAANDAGGVDNITVVAIRFMR